MQRLRVQQGFMGGRELADVMFTGIGKLLASVVA